MSEVCLHHCFSCVGAMRHRGESVGQISTSEISNQNFTFYANAVQAKSKESVQHVYDALASTVTLSTVCVNIEGNLQIFRECELCKH